MLQHEPSRPRSVEGKNVLEVKVDSSSRRTDGSSGGSGGYHEQNRVESGCWGRNGGAANSQHLNPPLSRTKFTFEIPYTQAPIHCHLLSPPILPCPGRLNPLPAAPRAYSAALLGF